MIDNILLGFSAIWCVPAIFAIIMGVLVGILCGVLPGLSASTAVADGPFAALATTLDTAASKCDGSSASGGGGH